MTGRTQKLALVLLLAALSGSSFAQFGGGSMGGGRRGRIGAAPATLP